VGGKDVVHLANKQYLTNIYLLDISQLSGLFLCYRESNAKSQKKVEMNSRAKVCTLFLGNAGLVPSSWSTTKVTYIPSSEVTCDTTDKLSRPEHPQRTGERKPSQDFGCDHGQTTGHVSWKSLLPSIG